MLIQVLVQLANKQYRDNEAEYRDPFVELERVKTTQSLSIFCRLQVTIVPFTG